MPGVIQPPIDEHMRLILASSSPRRQQLLAELGLDFDVINPQIDESRYDGEPALRYARRLSREKAAAVVAGLRGGPALALSADTIVLLGADDEGELLGKPQDAADARRMLVALRERAHQVITAYTLQISGGPARSVTRHERTIVHMRAYSDEEIETYIGSGDPFDKAGGYAIQNRAFHPVARIDGSYSNVVGLPIEAVKEALIEIGYPLPN